jgi:hypothetical protein
MIRNILHPHVKGAMHPYEDVPLVLVSGVGRSGTTALRHAFSAHPLVDSTASENNIIFDVTDTALHNCTYWSRKGTMRVVQPAYNRQFQLLLLNLLWPEPRRGKRRPAALVASSDMTVDRAAYLCQIFPSCKIPYIVRNGIEVVASRTAHENFKDVSFEEHCHIWTRAHAMALWGEGHDALVVVRHEALRRSPKETLAAALDACGLPFHEECLKQVVGKTFHPTQNENESREASSDLEQRHQRWERWDAQQRETFSDICGEAMRYFGYPMAWAAE